MFTIIQAVDVLPDYFEKICSILNMMSCYDSVKESLVMCYIVYNSEMQFKYQDTRSCVSSQGRRVAHNCVIYRNR